MLKHSLVLTTVLASLSLFASPAIAQYPTYGSQFRSSFQSPRSRPTISPYLNLLRGGGIGSNYYQRVRPEMEFRNASQSLNRSLETLRSRIDEQEKRSQELKSGLSQTGHAPRFMDYRGYFPGFGR